MKNNKINILEMRCVRGSGGGPEKTIFLTAKKIDSGKFQTHIVYIRAEEDTGFNLMRQQYLNTSSPNWSYKEVFEQHSFDWGLIKWAMSYCYKNNIDIIHSHEYKTDVICRMIKKRYPIDWVATYHLDYADSLKLKIYRKLDLWSLKKADKVFTVSRSLLNLLKQAKVPEKKLEYLPNGIDADYFNPEIVESHIKEEMNLEPETALIGFVGRLSAQKNIPLLLRAIQGLIVQGKKLRLLIVGEGPLKNQVQHLIQEMELENWVHLLGFVEDLREVYKSLDMLVLSSNNEGMPNSILEAMAMNVPVVSTAVSGIEELIENEKEGLIVPCGNSDALTEAMLKLINDPDLRQRMALAGREKVKDKFAFQNRVHRLEEVYKELNERNV